MKIAMFGIKGVPLPAGAENVVEQIGSRLVARGHEVFVFVRPHYTSKEMKEYRGMKLIHLPSIPTKNFDAISHSFLASFASLKLGVDIVHIHSTGNSIFAPVLKLRNIKTVVQSHGLDWQRAKWSKFAKAYLRMTDYTTVNFPSVTTVVSKKLKRHYEESYGKEVRYIPNGVDPFPKVAPQEIQKLGLQGDDYVLFLARLVPEKGAHYLIDAYRQLPNPGKKLVIAGDSNYGDQYAEKLKSQGNENILFTGFVRGRLQQELLSNAYTFVLPSEIEGLSTALLEAMSYGNCVLVSDIEENIEAIGCNGLTFQSKSVSDLKGKLDYLFQREDIVMAFRTQARQYVLENFNWDEITDAYEELYAATIKAN